MALCHVSERFYAKHSVWFIRDTLGQSIRDSYGGAWAKLKTFYILLNENKGRA